VKIAIGCDHGGFEHKLELIKFLKKAGHTVKDLGSFNKESSDYLIFAYKVSKAVASGRFTRGVLICKTGVGMAVSANKVKGIRAAVVHNIKTAIYCREHNDSNVIVFGSMFIRPKKAKKLLRVWLRTRTLGGRHRRRVNQIKNMEGC